MKVVDYRSSFVLRTSIIYQTSSDCEGYQNNTGRTQILAKCTLSNQAANQNEVFYLDKACIGEHMYLGDQIAQIPTSEVCGVFGENTWKILKKFANHENDVVQVKEPGQKQRQFDGTFYDYASVQFQLCWAEARLLLKPEEVIEATLRSQPMIGRTTLINEKSQWQAVLEYPIIYMNVHAPTKGFGVDVGPVLYPDLAAETLPLVTRLDLAYIMYQRFDKAEFAVRVPTQMSENSSLRTLHYSKVVSLEGRNELFSLVT